MSPYEKVEFIDGKVIQHSPSRKDHLDVTKRLLKLLDTYVSVHKLGTVLSEKCLCAFPRNFNCRSAFPLHRTTRSRVNFEDYAAHGVDEYWLIDTQAQSVEQYCRAKETYVPVPHSPANELQSRIIKGLSLPVVAVFNEAENLKTLRQILDSPAGRR